MTKGSCHRTQESNVQTWLKPPASASRARSTTAVAGGSVCRTRPISTAGSYPGLPEMLGELPPDESAVARLARVGAAGDDLPAAGEHSVDAAGDPHALVARVVDRHVVRLGGDDLLGGRVVDHDV